MRSHTARRFGPPFTAVAGIVLGAACVRAAATDVTLTNSNDKAPPAITISDLNARMALGGATEPSAKPEVIPLPMAAWMGLSTLGAMGIVGGVRKFRRRYLV